ncbi:unnamed protein product [Phaedon cochleariae]|uniref:Uncharacterized protein n=1 Tax=Phaedon cochleariae TaxID=80249 RepID=A0A9P0GJ13_PHACE|nr:unnamed protein product [Phaedon cochleariae]
MNEFENKLNRSHSESDLYNVLPYSPPSIYLRSQDIYKNSPTIIRRTVCIEEIVFPSDTMKPHSSRKQIFEKTEYGHNRSISFNDIRNESSRFTNQNSSLFPKNHLESSLTNVPMDIDMSNYDERYPKIMGSGPGTPIKTEKIDDTSENSRYKMFDNNLRQRLAAQNLNKAEFQNPEVSTIKCRNLADPQKLVHLKTVQDKKSNVKTIMFLLTAFAAVFIAYSIFRNEPANSDEQIQNIISDIYKNVHEQQNVVNIVVRSLEQRDSWPGKKKLLGFIGSQGVGKTHVTNIIKQHFARNLAHEIYGSHLYYKTEKNKILEAMDECCLNFIVIDDLRKKDDVELFAFMHDLPKDHFIFVISIFNIHYTTDDLETIVNEDDILEISESLDKSGLNQELVIFHDFTPEQIEDWIRKQLANQNVSSAVQESVMRDIFEAHDPKHGLKGLSSKITLELEKNKN